VQDHERACVMDMVHGPSIGAGPAGPELGLVTHVPGIFERRAEAFEAVFCRYAYALFRSQWDGNTERVSGAENWCRGNFFQALGATGARFGRASRPEGGRSRVYQGHPFHSC